VKQQYVSREVNMEQQYVAREVNKTWNNNM
jgi:hypothetical protein